MNTDKESPAIISRDDARELGLKKFFTGEECCHGHVAKRTVANGLCYTCKEERQIKRSKLMSEKKLRSLLSVGSPDDLTNETDIDLTDDEKILLVASSCRLQSRNDVIKKIRSLGAQMCGGCLSLKLGAEFYDTSAGAGPCRQCASEGCVQPLPEPYTGYLKNLTDVILSDMDKALIRDKGGTDARKTLAVKLHYDGARYCHQCETLHPVSEFWNTSDGFMGLSLYCKVCVGKNNNQWQEKNPEKQRRYSCECAKRRYAESSEVRAVVKAAAKLRRAVKFMALPLIAYLGDTNIERANLRREHHAAVRTGFMGYTKFVTAEYKREMDELEETRQLAQEFTGVTMSLDHIVPLKPRDGNPRGLHSADNMQVLPHVALNCPKNNKPAKQFLVERPDYTSWYYRLPQFEEHVHVTACGLSVHYKEGAFAGISLQQVKQAAEAPHVAVND